MSADERKAVTVFVAVFLYFTGFLLVDYGASLRLAGGHGESLLVAAMQPRVMYHAGLLSQIAGFFLLYAVAISYILNARETVAAGELTP